MHAIKSDLGKLGANGITGAWWKSDSAVALHRAVSAACTPPAPRVQSNLAPNPEQVGDTIPDVTLDKPTGELGFPPEKISLRDYTAGRKVILMGLPGAFTPT